MVHKLCSLPKLLAQIVELRSNISGHIHVNCEGSISLYMYITTVNWPVHVRARIDVTRYVKLVEICQSIVMIISHWAITSLHHLSPPSFCLLHQHSTRHLFHMTMRYLCDILLEKGTYLNMPFINLAEFQSHFSPRRLKFQYRKDTLCIELQNFSFQMVKSNFTFDLMSVSTEMRAVRGLICKYELPSTLRTLIIERRF